LTARIVGPETIGIASTVTSIVMVVSGFLMLDVYLGMKRQLGIAFAENNLTQFKLILSSATIFVTLSLFVTLVVIMIPNFQITEILGIERDFVWVLALIIPAYTFNTLFAEALITLLKSKSLIGPMLIGTITRFPVFFIFIFILNYPSVGTILSYFSLFFVSTLFYAIELYRHVKQSPVHLKQTFKTGKEIVLSGLASWIPHIINVLGSQLSLITVFTIAGASEAGKFYLPMSIFTLTLFIVSGITRVIHPLLSGMQSKVEQNNLISYSTKMAFLLTMPLTAVFLLYAGRFLEIIGPDYVSGSEALSILMLGVPFAIITEMYYYYVYANGNRAMLIYLGLAGNFPRLFLYFILVPWWGLNGSAIAYVAGTVCQLIMTIMLSKSYPWKISYKDGMIMSIIPIAIGTVFVITEINFILSIISVFLFSLLVFIKLHYFTEKELHLTIYSILSQKHADKIYNYIVKIFRRIQ
jgi:O-antigen/teichoic acid export membrane protein